METLTENPVIGVWRCVRTEIPPPYDPSHDFLHFTAGGVHALEYRQPDGRPSMTRFRYELTEGGARIENRKGKFFQFMAARREGDLLVITPRHGSTSWLERIPAADLPPLPPLCREPLPETPPEASAPGAS